MRLPFQKKNDPQPLQPNTPMQPGEVMLTPQQAATLESIPRSARRAVLAHMQSRNPKRQAKLRSQIITSAHRRAAQPDVQVVVSGAAGRWARKRAEDA
jgi:hypothetical protein